MRQHRWMLSGWLVASLLFAGTAWAAADRHELVPPETDPPEPEATGQVVIVYVQGQDHTRFQVNVHGLAADADYSVWMLEPAPHGDEQFTTRANGSGHLHVIHEGDHTMHQPVVVVDQALLADVAEDPEAPTREELEEATVLTTE